jgi:hypothetical protein
MAAYDAASSICRSLTFGDTGQIWLNSGLMCARPTEWAVDFFQRVVNAVFSGVAPDDLKGQAAEAAAAAAEAAAGAGDQGSGVRVRAAAAGSGVVAGSGAAAAVAGSGAAVSAGSGSMAAAALTGSGGVPAVALAAAAVGAAGEGGGISYGFKRDQPAVWHVLSQVRALTP